MTVPDAIRKLLRMYDLNDDRLVLTFKVVPDADFISKYGNQPFGLLELEVPESINEKLNSDGQAEAA